MIHANGSKLLKVECKYATMDRVQLTKHKAYQRKLQISSSVSSVGEGLVKAGGGQCGSEGEQSKEQRGD